MINREEALAVFSRKLVIAIVKILPHIIELKRPIAMIDHIPTVPLNTKAVASKEITISEKIANIFGLEFLNISKSIN